MRLELSFLLFFLCFLLHAQEEPPSDMVPLCKPGVAHKSPGQGLSLEYGLLYDQDQEKNEAGEDIRAYERINMKLKLPIVLKENFKVLIGVSHRLEDFQFGIQSAENIGIQSFSYFDRQLKKSAFNVMALRSLTPKHYLIFIAEASFNGDFAQVYNFDKRYALYKAAGILGIKKNENEELGLGLSVAAGFRGTSIYPFIVYNKTFNDKWGLESILPVKVHLRRNFNHGNLLLIGAQFLSRSYSIDLDNSPTDPFHLTRQEIMVSAAWQKQLKGWLWASASTGYIFSLSNRVRDVHNTDMVKLNGDSGVFAKVGLFLSPGKKMCK